MAIRITPPELASQENVNWVAQKKKLPGKPIKTLSDSFQKNKPVVPQTYNKLGQMQGVQKKQGTLLDNFKSFRVSVENQMDALFKSYIETEGNEGLVGMAKEELGAYFTENPDALEAVANGEIPEYWNMENTAGRMFSIVIAGFNEETDLEGFYEKALDFVNQAYDEVSFMIGFDFPPVVQDTKEALLNGLEQLKDGVPIEDITFS